MQVRMTIASIIIGGACVVGCNKSSDSTSTTPGAAGNNMSNMAGTAANSIGNMGAAAGNNMSNMAATAANSMSGMATTAANNMNGNPTTPADSSMMDTAKAKIQKITDDISSKNFDDAESNLKDLENMKSSLPQGLQDQITNLRTTLNGAKAANGAGVNLPSLPSMGH